jgi:hypothetical protein
MREQRTQLHKSQSFAPSGNSARFKNKRVAGDVRAKTRAFVTSSRASFNHLASNIRLLTAPVQSARNISADDVEVLSNCG